MPEQLLDRPDIITAFQKMRGKTVAQGVAFTLLAILASRAAFLMAF